MRQGESTNRTEATIRGRAIASQIVKDDYEKRGFAKEYVVYSVAGTIQSKLFEENFTYDVLSREERRTIVEEVLRGIDLRYQFD